MSAGAFTRAFYETEEGFTAPILVQEETLQAVLGGETNASATGPADAGIPSARVSAGRRELGIIPRAVSIRWTGTPPAGYSPFGTVRIPILLPATFAAATLGAAVTYLGTGGSVVGRSSEEIN